MLTGRGRAVIVSSWIAWTPGCDVQRVGTPSVTVDDHGDRASAFESLPASAERPSSARCEAPGIVSASRTLVLSASEAGVAQLRTTGGDRVTAGQPVAVIDNPELVGAAVIADALAQSTRARRGVAERRIRQARIAVEEVERLGEFASGNEARRADHDRSVLQAELREAGAIVRQHEAAASMASQRRDGLTVRAPFDGVVADVFVESGARVAQGAAIMRVVAPERTRLRLAVSETIAGGMAVGQRIDWRTIDGRHGGAATVSVVAAEVDAHAGVVIAEARVDPGSAATALPSGAAIVVTLPCEPEPPRPHEETSGDSLAKKRLSSGFW